MHNQPLEIADVFRKFIYAYRKKFGHLMLPSHHKAASDIIRCMTEEMGGGRYQCSDCDEQFWSYTHRV